MRERRSANTGRRVGTAELGRRLCRRRAPEYGDDMSHDQEPSLRQQLIDARMKIVAQLDELNFRANATGAARRGNAFTFDDVIAELEGELREINALLDENRQQDC